MKIVSVFNRYQDSQHNAGQRQRAGSRPAPAARSAPFTDGCAAQWPQQALDARADVKLCEALEPHREELLRRQRAAGALAEVVQEAHAPALQWRRRPAAGHHHHACRAGPAAAAAARCAASAAAKAGELLRCTGRRCLGSAAGCGAGC